MPQVHESIHGRRASIANQLFGLEVELEQCRVPPDGVTGWNVDIDGSLRNNGREFILEEPKTIAQARTALQRLDGVIRESHDSVRCSFHVHVDVRGWSTTELANCLRAYVTLEDSFFELSGNRSGSQFCTPVVGSSVEREVRSIIKREAVHGMNFDRVKYSALNVGHIAGLGSLEFRHHKGLTSAAEGITWLNRVAHFCDTSRDLSRDALRDAIINQNLDDLRFSLFGESLPLNPVDSTRALLNFKCTEIG